MPDSKIILPVVHLNGTGPKTLFEGYDKLDKALREAERAEEALEFNPRDYYPHSDPEAFKTARAQREERLRKLKTLREEVSKILDHVSDEAMTRGAL